MIWLFCAGVILHILCCIFIYAAIEMKLLTVHKYMFFVALFLPFWGALTILLLHFQVALKEDNVRSVGVEKMKLENEIYRSIRVEERKNSDAIVPMEEALLINSAHERRELIMDVLNDNPSEYIEFLQKAGDNDDTEVVHYAVTAMVEISKENDYALQKFEQEYAQDSENYELLERYCEFLWNCLEQNLMRGQIETINRNLFDELISKKISKKPLLSDYIKKVKNALKLKNYTIASSAIEKMEKTWQKNEDVILLKLQYYASTDRGDKIKELLDTIEREHIYLSAKGKEEIAFWKN